MYCSSGDARRRVERHVKRLNRFPCRRRQQKSPAERVLVRTKPVFGPFLRYRTEFVENIA